jgi:hypothetical protein
LLLFPIVATNLLTSEVYYYYEGTWHGRGCY